MPPMPSDPRGILRPESDASEIYSAPSTRRRRRETDPAAAAATASASALALANEEDRRRRGDRSRDTSQNPPVSVRVRVHDDPNRNITLRMLTEEETRRRQHRRRNDSVSSHSGNDSPTASRRYRRDSSSRGRAESAAERRVEQSHGPEPSVMSEDDPVASLAPPNPGFARRAGGGKDSAYYSSGTPQAGPSGAMPAAGATVSTLDSPGGLMSPGGSHATFTSGPLNDAAAADRRRRRRLERRDGSRQPTSVDFT
jgi:hypothetical protein